MQGQQQFDHTRHDRDYNLEAILTNIENTLPPVVSRAEASRLSGGLISAKTLSNEDALGKGPSQKIRVGLKVGYTKEAFMGYLRKKICIG